MAAAPLLTAVRQAAVMVDDETKRVAFRFGKNKLTLEAQGATTGRSKVEMPVGYEGKAMDIGFNPAYLVEMLKVVPAGRRVDVGSDRRGDAGIDPLRSGLFVFSGADQHEVGAGVSLASGGRKRLIASCHHRPDAESASSPARRYARRDHGHPPRHARTRPRERRRDPQPGCSRRAAGVVVRAGCIWKRPGPRRPVPNSPPKRASPPCARGVLEVVVGNAVLLQELAHFHKRRLLEQLRGRLPNTPLTDLRSRRPGGINDNDDYSGDCD